MHCVYCNSNMYSMCNDIHVMCECWQLCPHVIALHGMDHLVDLRVACLELKPMMQEPGACRRQTLWVPLKQNTFKNTAESVWMWMWSVLDTCSCRPEYFGQLWTRPEARMDLVKMHIAPCQLRRLLQVKVPKVPEKQQIEEQHLVSLAIPMRPSQPQLHVEKLWKDLVALDISNSSRLRSWSTLQMLPEPLSDFRKIHSLWPFDEERLLF